MGSLFRADTQLRKSVMQPDVPHSGLSSRLLQLSSSQKDLLFPITVSFYCYFAQAFV